MQVKPKEIPYIKIKDGQKVGLTSGCFDLLHFYHLNYLQRCRAYCDVLIVGVDADDVVAKNKGKAPANPEYHRAAMVESLDCVSAVFILRSLKDLVSTGDYADYLFKNSNSIYGEEVVGAHKAELIIVPDVEEVTSTTALKEKIRKEP